MTGNVDRVGAALADRYRIERELGTGGMATVYLARDLKNDRQVAIKVLRPERAAILGADRFLAEIKTTANLQHPHIVALFDSGVADGTVFYVMPFVQGESLRDRLTREKQLPIDEAVRIARETASALDYAHRHGVVHRDIKPENILLHDGQAVVADFGIALAATSVGGDRMTETGLSLGTPHYMSPEQAMGGRNVDARTDVYALGCVLYEMLTGEPPFTGPTPQSVAVKVMTDEPRPPMQLRKTIPPHVAGVALTALAKLPADRFASAAAFAEALLDRGYSPSPASGHVAPNGVSRPDLRRMAWPAIAVTLAVAALWGWLRPGPVPPPPPVERFTLSLGPGAMLADGPGVPVALSPDGARLVYLGLDSQGTQWLFGRGREQAEPTPIGGTRDAGQPFYSPDGQWLGFVQNGRIRKVPVAGGGVVTICELPSTLMQGAAWGPDGVIVFSSGGRLYQVASNGGPPTLAAKPDSAAGSFYRWPDVLPDGRHVVFVIGRTGDRGPPAELAVLSLDDSVVRKLGQAGMSPRWVDAGFLVFTQGDNTLFAAPFDDRRARFIGPPERLADGVQFGVGLAAKMGIARRTGDFAYVEGSAQVHELVLLDRQGREEVLRAAADNYSAPRFSPDGARIAVAVGAGTPTGPTDLWVYDRASRARTRLTFDSVSYLPTWEAGGRSIVYPTFQGGRPKVLFRIRADGSGTPELLLARPSAVQEVAFTPDHRSMVLVETPLETKGDIWVVPVDSPANARPLLRTPFNEREIALSPNGRWLAYVSDEAGSDDVYVRGLEEGSPRWRVSTSGGTEPRWGAGGRELLYRHADSAYAADVPSGAEFRTRPPRTLFGGRFVSQPMVAMWDVSADGSRFVFVRSTRAGESRAVRLVLHWFERRQAGIAAIP